jgi:hypothetical protein
MANMPMKRSTAATPHWRNAASTTSESPLERKRWPSASSSLRTAAKL